MNSTRQNATLLRRSLRGNAVFSFLSGLVFLLAHEPLAQFIGLSHSALLLLTGISLLGFAGWLYRNSMRRRVNLIEARIAVILDLAWVLGSGLIFSLGVLSSGGNWVLILIADVVLAFAVLQHLGLRKMRGDMRESTC